MSATSPGDVRFTSVRLSETSPLIGKNIVTSRFRDTYESLLVAVQRDDDYMQPDVSVTFSPGDVLWVVGDVNRLAAIG